MESSLDSGVRNRETEWSYPLLRFVGAFFVPPALVGALEVGFLLLSGELSGLDVPLALVSGAYGALFATAIPSIFFFLALEKLVFYELF